MDGKTMMRAYSEMYLEDAMHNLGVMIDYGTMKDGDAELFFSRFIASGISEQFGIGNPKYVAGMSGIELAETVLRRTGTDTDILDYYPAGRSAEYWMGWVLAYLQWYTALPFRQIVQKGITIDYLYGLYGTYHEADITKFLDTAQKRMAQYDANGNSPLKRQRKNCNLTQQQLAQRSGISLRMIQAYEQGCQDISKAEAGSVIKLAKALYCDPESLIPFK